MALIPIHALYRFTTLDSVLSRGACRQASALASRPAASPWGLTFWPHHRRLPKRPLLCARRYRFVLSVSSRHLFLPIGIQVWPIASSQQAAQKMIKKLMNHTIQNHNTADFLVYYPAPLSQCRVLRHTATAESPHLLSRTRLHRP